MERAIETNNRNWVQRYRACTQCSQLSSEDSSYRHLWARFWFLLAGACGVAMLITFASQLIKEAETQSANT